MRNGYSEDIFLTVEIKLSKDVLHHTRSIYTALDLLGDVGGLYSILISIGEIFLMLPAFASSSGLHHFLMKNIFMTPKKEDLSKSSDDDVASNNLEAKTRKKTLRLCQRDKS